MLDSVLKVYGDDFNVASFLQQHQVSVPVDSYKKGDADLLGNPNPCSGFDALISENESVEGHLAEIRSFLETNEGLFEALKVQGAICILDIGFAVGDADQFTQSIHVPTDLLGLCHKLNVSMEFSAYPSSAEGQ